MTLKIIDPHRHCQEGILEMNDTIPIDREMKNAVSYLRVSSVEQIDNYSLDNQLEQTNLKALRDGYQIIKPFREEGESAKTTNRPKLKELLNFCIDKKNDISAVFVYKWDRLSRNQLDFLSLRHMLSQHGISLISATETSGDTPEALFLQNILSSAAQYENDLKSVRVKEGNKKRFQAGLTSRPPFGYKRGLVDGKSCGVPDEKTFKPFQEIWYKADVNKWTLGRVKEELDNLRLTEKPFYNQTISKIFANKYYMGIITSKVYGEASGKHIPMVEPDVFYRVRELITGRKQAKSDTRMDIREEVPLRNHLTCPICARNMGGAPSKSKSGRTFWYYLCPERKTHKTYEVNADEVHKQFAILLQNIKVKPEVMKYFAEMMKETYEEQYSALISSSKEIEKSISELADLLEALEINNLKGKYTDEEYSRIKDKLNMEYITKKSLLSEKQIDKIEIDTVLEWMTFYLKNLDKAWERANIAIKHRIQSSLLPNKMTFDGKTLRTPELGLAYRLNELYEAQNNLEYRGGESNP